MNISNGQLWKYSSFIENKYYSFDKEEILKNISKEQIDEAYLTISKWDNYKPTPLLVLNKLSKELNLNKIYYKDESKRFNLKSFKALGGAYAVEKVTKKNKNVIVSSATAGNHGRAVAWGAKRLGLKCKIFVSEYVSEERKNAIEDLGAEVFKVKGNYENSLLECIKNSIQNNWQIIQDVAWKDYKLIPTLTMAGYTVMMKEIADKIHKEKITHIFLQAGVGGLAGAMIAGTVRYLKNIPNIIIVEPDSAACIMESIKSGKIEKINITRESLMGGMSCREPSLVPWEILKKSVNNCISLPDDDIGKAMKLFANGSFGEDKIVAGENSAPGVISLIAICNDENVKKKVNINSNSNILLFGCEGDTDQKMYQKLLKE